ncbi:MAG: DUF1772 domain-containing protein [Rhodobacteraceae bacterium]|nr:DUF1772 domain-containing protein [Paracoccaceae bacterium]
MRILTLLAILSSMLLSAAIFGFFYAWICSTMWGLDAADPRIAIQAMQAMNASVRNMIFAPAFFGTPVALLLTAALLLAQSYRKSAAYFAIGGAIYLCFGLTLTITINVPMNVTLGALTVPTDMIAAEEIWQTYSPKWQFWNIARTVASGISFLTVTIGLLHLPLLHRPQES